MGGAVGARSADVRSVTLARRAAMASRRVARMATGAVSRQVAAADCRLVLCRSGIPHVSGAGSEPGDGGEGRGAGLP